MTKNEQIHAAHEEILNSLPSLEPRYAMDALGNTNVYLFRYFPKLKMIVCNERTCRDFQIAPVYQNMPRSFAEDFVDEPDRGTFEQMYHEIDSGIPTSSTEFRGKTHKTWCRVTLTTVEWDSEKKPELCVGVVEDRSKEEMVTAELNSILSSISCGVLQYRMSDSALLRANKAALEILGYDSVEEMTNDRENGIAKHVLKADREYMNKLIEDLTEPGEVRTIEYRVKHPRSDQLRYCFDTVQVYDNIYGERIIQRSIMDITDRKLSEDMQQTNNELMERLDTVMHGILGGFEITLDDPELTYVFVSESVAALQGYTVKELLDVCGGNVLENIVPEDRERVKESMDSLTVDSPAYNIKYRLRHKDGHLIWVQKTGKKVIDRDGICRINCLVQDITQSQKSAEDLSKLLIMQRQMVSSLSCGVFAYTLPEREILIENKEAKRMFQDPGDKRPLNEAMLDDILPDDLASVREAVKSLRNVGDSCTYRLHPLQKDGTRITVECYTKLRAFADGKQFILSVLSDITKLEHRNEQLNEMNRRQEKMLSEIRKERQQYRNALVSGSDYSYRFDVTDGYLRSDLDYSNRGDLFANLGVRPPIHFDELTAHWIEAMSPVFLTPDAQNPMTTEELKACYERGEKHVATEYFNVTENKYYRRNFLLSEDEETGHLWAIAIVSDITDIIREDTRKRNELAMINRNLTNQINISKAFSSIYFASWEIDLEKGKMKVISVPDWGDEIQEKSGGIFRKAAELIAARFTAEDGREALLKFLSGEDMAERLKGESILSYDYPGIQSRWASACLIPSKRDEDGNVLKVVFALREISKEKKIELDSKRALEEAYEAANRANDAKTNFLSSVSHDIRTPMNGIIGMTAIAATHLEDQERVADCLAKISVSSKHLLGLINEVLDMNKIESGKLDLNSEEFSLPELIDNLLVMSKSQLEGKQHALSVTIQSVEHEQVIGDSLRIQQVFMNLLSNSIKYTPPGGKISLGLCEKETNNPKIGCFEFTVEDNGIGMSKEFQEMLFEPFTRAKDSRVEKMQGSGLGMPIAKNIVRMMNGDITVESELSKGTKFTVTLYLELQEPDESISSEDFVNLPILVADDDQIACESTCSILAELGMKGEWVLTGEEAVEKTVARHESDDDYFAVILDWKMPGMDGVATAREIRRLVGPDIPIIILSAYDWSDIEQEAREAGVTAFISKPVFKSRISYLFKSLMGQEQAVKNVNSAKNLADVNFGGHRALLAEDNELNAEIATELLGMTGLVIDHAPNGKAAVDLFAEKPAGYYDIIFMDIQMPLMTGYEAARAIRAMDGDYAKKIPIIAMTANAFAEDVRSAKKAGMNEHVAKPLNIAHLITTIEHWLK